MNTDAIMATYDFDETIELLETEVETVKENSDEPSKASTGHQREKQLKLPFEKLPPAQVPRDASHAGNVSASDRTKQFKDTTHDDGGKLFCSVCNIVLDHSRKSSVEKHLLTSKHLAKVNG